VGKLKYDVPVAAMESTGVYWNRSVTSLRLQVFRLLLSSPNTIKVVTGRIPQILNIPDHKIRGTYSTPDYKNSRTDPGDTTRSKDLSNSP
jgi:hypothetical protein